MIGVGITTGREIKLNSEYHKEKWEFGVKEPGGYQWLESYQEEGSGVKGEAG